MQVCLISSHIVIVKIYPYTKMLPTFSGAINFYVKLS